MLSIYFLLIEKFNYSNQLWLVDIVCGVFILFRFQIYSTCDIFVTVQQASKDIAKEKESLEKAKRAKEAQEKRERERQEKIARTNALVDINGGMLMSSFLVFVKSIV